MVSRGQFSEFSIALYEGTRLKTRLIGADVCWAGFARRPNDYVGHPRETSVRGDVAFSPPVPVWGLPAIEKI